LIISRFDAVASTSLTKRSASEQATDDNTPADDDNNDEDHERPLPKKKQKKNDSVIDTDAKLAARLQALEDLRARGRLTRGGGGVATSARAVGKEKTGTAARKKQKSAAKVRSEDDSEVEGGAGQKRKRSSGSGAGGGGGGGFQKPFILSAELSAVCGGEKQVGFFFFFFSRSCAVFGLCCANVRLLAQLSRPQVVKKLWEYIKGNELQDPSDKRQIICDGQLKMVLGDRTNAFSMNKLIGKHLYPVEE
jgi:upstream activation factor subunit UAF30